MSAELLYNKLKNIRSANPLCAYDLDRCRRLYPLIEEINALKHKKNALILAHTYVHPDIIYGVADHTGDSFGLAKAAKQADCDIIVFPSVRFMAETAKILNPSKIVIDPNPNGKCSLADSIDTETVYKLREQYPHHTFVCYINTTAAVKAACDVCVTSSNALKVLENIPSDKIYFLPDKLMGQNLKNSLKGKELLYYSGTCYVHEEYQPEQIDFIRTSFPNATVLAHPECHPDVASKADVVSSTTGMIDYIKTHGKGPFLVLTECGVSSRIQAEYPEAELIGSCIMCKYMRSNSLEAIRQALLDPLPSQIIEIDPQVQKGALSCLEAMFSYS